MNSRASLLMAFAAAVFCHPGSAAFSADVTTAVPEHRQVYAVPGRFAGWPANHGIWSWGQEILVGFSVGYSKDNGPDRHAIDHDRPEEHLLARSFDGGDHWTIENPARQGDLIPVGKTLHGITPPGLEERPWQDCAGLDFQHPDFAMTLRMTDHHTGPSRIYASTDRGHHWSGPYRLTIADPSGKPLGIAARTDYLIDGQRDCVICLTAAKSDGREGRPFCARTSDGARSWQFVNWIGDEPAGYSIMPSSIRLSPTELFTTIRCREGERSWIEAYRSRDNGRSWDRKANPVDDLGEGNPSHLIRLSDGRLCLTYGFRAAPFEIRTCLSRDDGKTWGPALTLRGNGGGRDLGYPVSIQRPDGKVVTIYYFHDRPLSDRYVAATIWTPPEI